MYMYTYIHTYIDIYTDVCICIFIEREREMYHYIYIYIHMYICGRPLLSHVTRRFAAPHVTAYRATAQRNRTRRVVSYHSVQQYTQSYMSKCI